jgi:DNA polymerase-3 subunit alpha
MLEELQKMDLEKPVAVKVSITKDDQFTKIAARKVMELDKAAKEKIKTKVKEVSYDPITIEVEMGSDEQLLEKLYALIQKHTGAHKINLLIKSKLQEVFIETNYASAKEIENVIKAFPELKIAG